MIICVVILGMSSFVCDEITLEKSHLVFAVQRRNRTAPQIPEQIGRVLFFFGRVQKIRFVCHFVQLIQHRFARIFIPLNGERKRFTVIVKRDTAMKQQVSVYRLVH